MQMKRTISNLKKRERETLAIIRLYKKKKKTEHK